MNELQAINQSVPVAPDQQYSPQQITLDDSLFNKCSRLAQVMASGRCTVPKHLQGNEGDCFAIIGQSLRWGMDPYAVAQKTHVVNGTLGYEAQLVIAVINNRAPISDRISFEYFGDWSKVKTKDDKSDAGVICRATFKGDDEPTELSLTMAQVGNVRNSPLWAADPRQQLAYLAAKRWARLNCPDVILGVYTPDELNERNAQPKDVSPVKTKNAGASALLERVKSKKATVEAPAIEYFDTSDLLSTIGQAQDLKQITNLGEEIKALTQNASINLKDDDLETLRQTWKDKKTELEQQSEFDNIMKNIKACKSLDDVERMRGVIEDKSGDFAQPDLQLLSDTLDMIAEEIGAEG